MPASFEWLQTYGSSPGTETTATNLNLTSSNAGVDQSATSNPITVGQASYELFVRAYYYGTFNKVNNIQFWKSAGDYVTGEQIKWKGDWTGGTSEYSTPVTTTSTIATVNVPTADPATANVTVGEFLTGELTTTGYSDFVVLQNQSQTTTPPGNANQKTLTLQYDEQ